MSHWRRWAILLAIAIVAAAGWCGLWYSAAAIANRTLSGWLAREAEAGRVYSCGSQSITGFPFRIEVRCTQAAATIKGDQPLLDVDAKDIAFIAEVYHPTELYGDVAGPVTVSEPGQPPRFSADWARAQITVSGVPPYPDSVAVTLDGPRLDRVADAGTTMLFGADHADIVSRVVAGSPADQPVIDTTLRFSAATAPSVHALLSAPLQGEIEVVLRGLKDLGPKPWRDRFREMQAAGGGIEIKRLRIERSDAAIVGGGELTVNANGKLDGVVKVAIVGLDRLVPQLGLDQLINRSINRLTGAANQPAAPNALDRLMPGLSGIVRDSANATIIDNLNKMGQPTEIDKKPAVVLPLRFADGSMYLGLLPLGNVPPLF